MIVCAIDEHFVSIKKCHNVRGIMKLLNKAFFRQKGVETLELNLPPPKFLPKVENFDIEIKLKSRKL